MANVEPKQRPRYLRHNHLCIANRKHIMPTQVAGGGQEAPIEADSCVASGMNDPDAIAAFDLDGDSGAGTWNDNVGTFATDGRCLAECAITNRLVHTYLCVSARTRQRPIGHSSACGPARSLDYVVSGRIVQSTA